VDVTVSVLGADDSGDGLRSLRAWLVTEDDLRGRVRFVASPPEQGTLGSMVETLAISLGPGGAATVLASALIAWIRRQKSNIKLKVSRPDGTSVEVATEHVSLTGDEVRQLTNDLMRFVSETTEESDSDRG
jgi:hypothetical protein